MINVGMDIHSQKFKCRLISASKEHKTYRLYLIYIETPNSFLAFLTDEEQLLMDNQPLNITFCLPHTASACVIARVLSLYSSCIERVRYYWLTVDRLAHFCAETERGECHEGIISRDIHMQTTTVLVMNSSTRHSGATDEGEMHLVHNPSPRGALQLWLRWNSSLSADRKGRRVDVSLSLFPTTPNAEAWAVNTSESLLPGCVCVFVCVEGMWGLIANLIL